MWMYIVFKEVQKCVCQITETFKVHSPEYFFCFFFSFSHRMLLRNFSLKSKCHVSRSGGDSWRGDRDKVAAWNTDQRRMDTTGLWAFFPVVLFEFKFNLTLKIGYVKAAQFHTKQNWKQSHLPVALYLLVLSQLKATVVLVFFYLEVWDLVCSQCQC